MSSFAQAARDADKAYQRAYHTSSGTSYPGKAQAYYREWYVPNLDQWRTSRTTSPAAPSPS